MRIENDMKWTVDEIPRMGPGGLSCWVLLRILTLLLVRNLGCQTAMVGSDWRNGTHQGRSVNKNRGILASMSDYDLSKPWLRTIQISCYSCMSSEFEKHWPTLSFLYNRPKNFTDVCLDMPRRSRIGAVQCDSACLTIVERRVSGGVLVTGKPNGYNVARGCLTNVFKVNLESKLRTLKRTASTTKSICDDMDTGEVVPQVPVVDERPGLRGHSPYSSPVHRLTLCTCYGELCNNQPLSAASSVTGSWIPLLCLLVLCATISCS